MSLTKRILIAMGLGILVGSLLEVLVPRLDQEGTAYQVVMNGLVFGLFDVVGQIFITLLKFMVVPLVLVTLVCGVSALGQSSRMGPIAAKTIGLYLFTTACAVALGLLSALAVGPGRGVNAEASVDFDPKPAPPITDTIVGLFPSNPFAAMAEANVLQVIVFALLLGLALTRAGDAGSRIIKWFQDMEVVVMRMVTFLIELAPWGVFALLAKLFATMGFAVIFDLAAYFFTLLGALIFQALVVYGVLLRSITPLAPSILRQKMRSVWAFAFSTSSSSVTLPVTMQTVERRLGVNKSVSGFSLPLGATVNMDGTAIMQGVATVFIAQVYAIDLSTGQLLMVILTASLASIGSATVPSAGLIMLSLVLTQAGLPLEGVALILGVDRLLDMVRTAVNVTGDATVSLIVAYHEQALDLDVYHDPDAGDAAEQAAT